MQRTICLKTGKATNRGYVSPRYDTHRQSLFVFTMWTNAVNICIMCKTDEDLPELSINHKLMLLSHYAKLYIIYLYFFCKQKTAGKCCLSTLNDNLHTSFQTEPIFTSDMVLIRITHGCKWGRTQGNALLFSVFTAGTSFWLFGIKTQGKPSGRHTCLLYVIF